MAEDTVIIEIGTIRTGLDHKHAIVEIAFRSEQALSGGGQLRVWIPEKDSLSELKKDALVHAKRFLEGVIKELPE
jgi:hypothetical protein